MATSKDADTLNKKYLEKADLVFLGDSIVAGIPPSLHRHYFQNFGVSGACVDDVLSLVSTSFCVSIIISTTTVVYHCLYLYLCLCLCHCLCHCLFLDKQRGSNRETGKRKREAATEKQKREAEERSRRERQKREAAERGSRERQKRGRREAEERQKRGSTEAAQRQRRLFGRMIVGCPGAISQVPDGLRKSSQGADHVHWDQQPVERSRRRGREHDDEFRRTSLQQALRRKYCAAW